MIKQSTRDKILAAARLRLSAADIAARLFRDGERVAAPTIRRVLRSAGIVPPRAKALPWRPGAERLVRQMLDDGAPAEEIIARLRADGVGCTFERVAALCPPALPALTPPPAPPADDGEFPELTPPPGPPRPHRGTILVHGGPPHADDLIGSGFAVAANRAGLLAPDTEIVAIRRTRNLANVGPHDIVLDMGGKREGRWFDHHQLGSDDVCTLTLLLEELGLLTDALALWTWLRPLALLDNLGPEEFCTRWHIPRSQLDETAAAVCDRALLTRFSARSWIKRGEVLFEMLALIGQGLLAEVRAYQIYTAQARAATLEAGVLIVRLDAPIEAKTALQRAFRRVLNERSPAGGIIAVLSARRWTLSAVGARFIPQRHPLTTEVGPSTALLVEGLELSDQEVVKIARALQGIARTRDPAGNTAGASP